MTCYFRGWGEDEVRSILIEVNSRMQSRILPLHGLRVLDAHSAVRDIMICEVFERKTWLSSFKFLF